MKLLGNCFRMISMRLKPLISTEFASMPLNSCRFSSIEYQNQSVIASLEPTNLKGKVDVKKCWNVRNANVGRFTATVVLTALRWNRFASLRFNRTPRSHSSERLKRFVECFARCFIIFVGLIIRCLRKFKSKWNHTIRNYIQKAISKQIIWIFITFFVRNSD